MAVYDDRYITLAEVKRELPFADEEFAHLSGTEFDELINGDSSNDGLLERESTRLETWANTKWEVTNKSESLERPEHVDGLELPLPNLPIDSVNSVSTEDEGSLSGGGTDYHVLETHLRIEEDSNTISAWPTGFQEIDVDWDYGYSTVPQAVKSALIRLVRNALEQIAIDGITSESEAGNSYQYRVPGEMKREIKMEIEPHSAPSYYGGTFVS